MDRCLCLRFLLRRADTNSRGFEPATLVVGPAALTELGLAPPRLDFFFSDEANFILIGFSNKSKDF